VDGQSDFFVAPFIREEQDQRTLAAKHEIYGLAGEAADKQGVHRAGQPHAARVWGRIDHTRSLHSGQGEVIAIPQSVGGDWRSAQPIVTDCATPVISKNHTARSPRSDRTSSQR
jgi:hypothetical protein